MARLSQLDPSKARLVELRFFAGLSLEEAARAMGASPSTIQREWRTARAWLQSDGPRKLMEENDTWKRK